MVRFPILFLFLLALTFIFSSAHTHAYDSMTETISGNATTTLSVMNDEGAYLTLTADNNFTGMLTYLGGMVEMDLQQASPSHGTTTLTLSGLVPNTTYHQYQNGYEQHATTTTGAEGVVTLEIDLIESQYVVLQEHKSTLFIRDDTTGGDCALVGTWDLGSRVCTLTQDVTETIELANGGITIDGNGNTLVGPGSGNGIFIRLHGAVTIKNLTIENFSTGIRALASNGITADNVTFGAMSRGVLTSNNSNAFTVTNSDVQSNVWLQGGSNASITNTIFSGGGNCTLCLFDTVDALVQDNTLTPTTSTGIVHVRSSGSVFRNNTMTGSGLRFEGTSDTHHDNDIDTSNTIDGRPIVYTQGLTNETIDASNDPAMVLCINCTNVTITGVNPTPNYPGIYLYNNTNTTVQNATLEGHSFGIWLNGGEDNTLVNNVFAGNQTALRTQAANTSIYNNTFQNPNTSIGFLNTDDSYSQSLPVGGNYWEAYNTPAEGCQDANNDNICDDPFEIPQTFLGVTDDFPWTVPNAWQVNEPTNLGQFRILGVQPITPGETFVGNTAVFKAFLPDASTTTQLQIEVVRAGELFTGMPTASSEFQTPGTTTSVEIENLIPKDNHYQPGGNEGSFKWQARIQTSLGVTSGWVPFSTSSDPDFNVKVVPLVTQKISNFPSRSDTEFWADEEYADGNSRCGRFISSCGCLISSLDMLSEFYGLDTAFDASDITPLNQNKWYNANKGYDNLGNLIWAKQSAYFGFYDGTATKTRLSLTDGKKDIPWGNSLIENDLENLIPVIGYSSARGHYLVVDSKVVRDGGTATYTIRDPRWFKTKTLSDTQINDNDINAYNNVLLDANRYVYTPDGIPVPKNITVFLASPAELVVTDSQGRRVGLDPVASTTYAEIPDSTYGLEKVVLSTTSTSSFDDLHRIKEVYIPNPNDEEYTIQVIGTGEGAYTVTVQTVDDFGKTHFNEVLASTTPNQVDEYTLTYMPDDPDGIMLEEKQEETSPEQLFAELKQIAKQSKIKPRFLKLRVKLNIKAASYFYRKGNISYAVWTLYNLRDIIERRVGSGIPEDDAQEMTEIIDQLLVLLQ